MDKSRILFVCGQYADGHVDVVDESRDVLIRVPRSIADPVCAWTEEEGKRHDDAIGEIVRLRRALQSIIALAEKDAVEDVIDTAKKALEERRT